MLSYTHLHIFPRWPGKISQMKPEKPQCEILPAWAQGFHCWAGFTSSQPRRDLNLTCPERSVGFGQWFPVPSCLYHGFKLTHYDTCLLEKQTSLSDLPRTPGKSPGQHNLTTTLIPLFPQRNNFYYDPYALHVQANQVQLCTVYNTFVIFLACLSMFISFFQWGLMRNCCDPVTLCFRLARLQSGQGGIFFLCFGLKPT